MATRTTSFVLSLLYRGDRAPLRANLTRNKTAAESETEAWTAKLTRPGGMATFKSLPPDILYLVFKKFNGPEWHNVDHSIFSLMRVCKAWETMAYVVLLQVNIDSPQMTGGFMMYMERRMSLLEFRCKIRESLIIDIETAEKLGIELEEEEHLALKDQRKRQFINETKTIMSYWGSWNAKPKTPRGSVKDFVWSELVMDQINEAGVRNDTAVVLDDSNQSRRRKESGSSLASSQSALEHERGT